jgi:transposase
LDLPWQGNAVQIRLRIRKFFCDNRACPQRVFAERVPSVAQSYARKTVRLTDALRELTYLAGGEAAARIAQTFGLFVSPDALLRHLRRAPAPSAAAPRVLGVDDFAFRRGHVYGAILIDLERHRPVDLLPDREAKTLEAWLQSHPGVEIISRDRGNGYIEGATKGAPHAMQVADRWHLLKNLGDTLERFLARHHRQMREAAHGLAQGAAEQTNAVAADAAAAPVPTPAQQRARQEQAECRCRREAHYERVRQLYGQGYNQSAIRRQTGLSPKTIRKYLQAQICPHYPERRRARATVVSPFAD